MAFISCTSSARKKIDFAKSLPSIDCAHKLQIYKDVIARDIHSKIFNDYREAYYLIALMYLGSQGSCPDVPINPHKAAMILEIKAKQGDCSAMILLGRIYSEQAIGIVDNRRAYFWFKSASIITEFPLQRDNLEASTIPKISSTLTQDEIEAMNIIINEFVITIKRKK